MLSNKLFNILKWIAMFVLPGAATFYFVLSGIWGLPYQGEIVGSLVAVNVWLSALLIVSNAQWQAVQIDSLTYKATGEDNIVNVPGAPFGMTATSYNILKWVTLAFLPASGALYFTLSILWGFPFGEQIVGTIAALTAFMGLLLGVSKARFNRSRV